MADSSPHATTHQSAAISTSFTGRATEKPSSFKMKFLVLTLVVLPAIFQYQVSDALPNEIVLSQINTNGESSTVMKPYGDVIERSEKSASDESYPWDDVRLPSFIRPIVYQLWM